MSPCFVTRRALLILYPYTAHGGRQESTSHSARGLQNTLCTILINIFCPPPRHAFLPSAIATNLAVSTVTRCHDTITATDVKSSTHFVFVLTIFSR